MTMREFIKNNRKELDEAINKVYNGKLNDIDREDWILNNEGLYLWAKSEGVRV